MITPLTNRDLLVKADFENGHWLWRRNTDGVFEGCYHGYCVGRGIPFSIQRDLHSWFIEGRKAFGDADTLDWREEHWMEYEAKGEALAHQLAAQSIQRFTIYYACSRQNPIQSNEKPKTLAWDDKLYGGRGKYGYPFKSGNDMWEGKITICFGHAESGWVPMIIINSNGGKHFVHLSEVYDPFPDIIKWFTMITRGEAAKLEVDEEGHSTWFSFCNIDEQMIEFVVESAAFDEMTKYDGTEREILAVVNRRAFVKEFYRRYTDFLENDFQQNHWDEIDPDDYEPEELAKILACQPPGLDLSPIREYLAQDKDLLLPLAHPPLFKETEVYNYDDDDDKENEDDFEVEEDKNTDNNEGHGDHWQAIDENYLDFIGTMIPRICQEGKLDGTGFFSFDVAQKIGWLPQQATSFALRYLETPIQYLALVVDEQKDPDEGKKFWSAYPICAEGVTHTITIDRIFPWKNSIESVIEAQLHKGGMIWFFDPFFYRNKDEYPIGRQIEVRIAGLAYMLRKAETNELEITEGPMLEIHRQQILKHDPEADVSTITSVPVSMKGASIFLPNDAKNGDAEIRMTIKHVDYLDVDGKEFCRILGTFMKREEQTFDTYIYAAPHVLKDYRPEVGDDIEALVWMQGYLLPQSYTPKTPEQEFISLAANPAQARLAMNYALAYNLLDTRWITDNCNQHIVYKPRNKCWNTSHKGIFFKHLKDRFSIFKNNLKRSGRIRCELATNPEDGASGVIFYQVDSDYQHGIGPRKFWVDIVPNDAGQFAAISFSMNDPSPANVIGSGLFPGVSPNMVEYALSYRPSKLARHLAHYLTLFVHEPMTEADEAMLTSVNEIAVDYPCAVVSHLATIPENVGYNERCKYNESAPSPFLWIKDHDGEMIVTVDGYCTTYDLRAFLDEIFYSATAEELEEYAVELLNRILAGDYGWNFDRISDVLDHVVAIVEPLGLEEKLDSLLNLAADYNTVALLKKSSRDGENMEKRVMARIAERKK